MFKKKLLLLFLLILNFLYADLLTISEKNKNIYDKLIKNWNISYKIGENKFIFDVNVSKAYFNKRVNGYVVDMYESENNKYICSYNLSYLLEDFEKFLEFICIYKDHYQSNNELKKFVTFNVNDSEGILFGRMGTLLSGIEIDNFTIIGSISNGYITQKFAKLEIFKGWNLLSLPVNIKIFKNDGTIPPIPQVGTNHYYFDIFGDYDSMWVFKNNSWIHNPLNLEKTEGFWIKSALNLNINLNSRAYFPDLIGLKSGWHLIGTGNSINNLNLIACIGCDIEAIWKYKNINRTWIKNPTIIEAGEGFWIKKK